MNTHIYTRIHSHKNLVSQNLEHKQTYWMITMIIKGASSQWKPYYGYSDRLHGVTTNIFIEKVIFWLYWTLSKI